MFKRLVPGDFAERHLPKDVLPNGRFAERTFAKLTFCRTDSLPK
jgi:hypothetical protein